MALLQRLAKTFHPAGAEIVDAQNAVVTPGLVKRIITCINRSHVLCQGAGRIALWVVANPLSDLGGLWSRRDARFRDAGAKRTCPIWLHDEFGSFVPVPKRRTP